MARNAVEELLRRRNIDATVDALCEELALRRIAGEAECRLKRLSGFHVVAEAKVKFADGGEEEWVCEETLAIRDRLDLLQAPCRTITLRDGDGSIKRHHGRGPEPHEHRVEANDAFPIGIVDASCGGVTLGDGGLDVVRRQLVSRGRERDLSVTFCDPVR